MSLKLKDNICPVCNDLKGRKKQKIKMPDLIERTTDCRLYLESGAGFEIREITSQPDDSTIKIIDECLCHDGINPKPRLPKPADNATKLQSCKNQRPTKENPTEQAGNFDEGVNVNKLSIGCTQPDLNIKIAHVGCQKPKQADASRPKNILDKASHEIPISSQVKRLQRSGKQLENIIVDTGQLIKTKLVNLKLPHNYCHKKFKKIVKPKWYHHLSLKQIQQLEELPFALSDDIDEMCIRRTSWIMKNMSLYPVPTARNINTAIRNSWDNVVYFLIKLLEISSQAETKEVDGNKLPDFSLNQRILMTAICYYEMPLLLGILEKASPKWCQHLPEWPVQCNKDAKSKPPKFPEKKNPYLSPAWSNTPHDWVAERLKHAQIDRQMGQVRRQMKAPSDLDRPTPVLSHIFKRPEIPEVIPTPTPEPIPDVCRVLQLFDGKPFGTSGESSSDSVSDYSNVTTDSVNHDFDIPEYKDIDTALCETFKFLEERGMICTRYPGLQQHPVIQAFIKHLQGLEITKGLKSVLLRKTAGLQRCLRELYTLPAPLSVPMTSAADSNWSRVETIRARARQMRYNFFRQLWCQRYLASVHVGHTLHPQYNFKKTFLPVFSAYMLPGHTELLIWP